MQRLSPGLVVVVVSIPLLASCEDRLADHSKPDLRDGLIAMPDGRPGPRMAQNIRAVEDDLSDVSVRQVDVIYGRKYGTALMMDVYQPKNEPNGAGIIQIVSGGLWSGPEYRRMPLVARNFRTLLERGYTVFAVMHSSQPKFTLLEIRDDVPMSVRYIRHHAHSLGIQPDRIGVMGLSSGGHLALLAATAAVNGEALADDPVDTASSKVQAVVAYFPNTDLLNYGKRDKLMPDHFREQRLKMDAAFDFRKWDEDRCIFVPMAVPEIREVFRETSPLTHVSSDDPPTLLFHGDKDELVPIQQSQEFERRMKEVGAHCELFVAEGEGHAWQEPLPGELDRVANWFDRYLVQIASETQLK